MAEQFKAQAGVTYENPITGQKVTFSAQDLSNEAAGFLSSQFKPVTNTTAQPTSTGQNIASTPQTTTLPQYIGSSGASKYTLQPNGTYAPSNFQQPILSGQTAQQATLINPLTGARVVVQSGSQDAQRFFGQGYILDTGQNTTDLNKERANQVLQQAQQNSRLAAPVMSDAGVKFPNQLSLDPTAVQRVDMRPIYDLGNPYENPENFTLINNPNDFQRLAAELGVIDGRTKEGDFFFRASSLDPNDQRIFVRSDVLQQAGVAPDGSAISFNDQSGAAPGQTPTLPEFKKFDLGSILNELPQDILSQSFETPKTSFDIETLLQENRALQAKYLESLIPGQQELELKQQIADVAEQAKNVLQSAELGIEQISDQPIAMQFIVGQAKNVEDRANLKLKALQNQETNLLNRLGIEQENRTITSNVLTNQLQFNQQNLDTLFKIQDRVIAQENQVFERAMALQSNSRDVLTSILQSFQGLDMADLTFDQQNTLAQLAGKAGVPIDLVSAGLANVKNQMMAANLAEQAKEGSKMLSLEEAAALGVPFGTTVGEVAALGIVPTGTGKPPTQFEAQSGAFALTLSQADLDLSRFNSLPDPWLGGDPNLPIPNAIKSSDRQVFDRSARAFVNAVLRRESGATITDSEFTNKYKELIPQLGDSAEVLASKKQARQDEISKMQYLSGSSKGLNSLFNQEANPYSANSGQSLVNQLGSVINQRLVAGQTSDEIVNDLSQNPEIGPSIKMLQDAGLSSDQIVNNFKTQEKSTQSNVFSYIGKNFANAVLDSVGLGSLSAPFESGGDPGRISSGIGDAGGQSYGVYQFTKDTVKTFLNSPLLPAQFKNALNIGEIGSDLFNKAWQDAAKQNPAEFTKAQEDFVKQQYFDPQVSKISKETGVNISSLNPILQQVVWSTAVQHGSSTNIIANVIKDLGSAALYLEPAKFITEVYKQRWNNGNNFKSSSPAVQQGVFNRFFGSNGELAKAISGLSNFL